MEDILKIAAENPIIPVVKLERAEDATKLARALCKGGICCMEITFRTAAAKDAIKKVAEEVPEMLVGAGTVIGAGAKQVVEITVPESWKDAEDEGLHMTHATEGRQDVIDFVNNIQAKVNAQEGNSLPVSAFKDYVDGTTPSGAAAYEKRGIAVNVPVWNPENCIQCNSTFMYIYVKNSC